ncbi:MAG: Fe-S protein assembly chaperone HscA [Bacteroidota bacterium]
MAKISINIKSGTLEKEDLVVGIDLGTTNSIVAFVNPDTGKPEVLGKAGELLVPSVVHITHDGFPMVGNIARQALITHPESTIFSVKRLLGRSYKDVEAHAPYYTYRILDEADEKLVRIEVNGKYFTPIELSAEILSELKRRAESITGKTVNRAVVTVPAYFNDSQRQATRDAGKMAGLEVLRIVNEPTAASLAYGLGLNSSEAKTIVVYDLGGGTFDVSVLRIEDGVFEVLSTQGDTYLGGDDFDREIVNHWLKCLPEKLHLEAFKSLRLLAEEAKRQVCGGLLFEEMYTHSDEQFKLGLDYGSFETITLHLMDKTMHSLQMALKDAKLTPDEIDEVVVVGGSTRMPFVKQRLASLFGHIKVNDTLNPDEVVALGAAVEADVLAGNRSDILLLDVTPLSLGIETLGGLMDVLIPRNTKIPCKYVKSYTTSVDGQVNMGINIYQGERELTAENRKLGELLLSGIPAMPAGLPKIEVAFLINADGILTVEAKELRSGVQQHIEIKPQYGLSDADVERMLLDSLSNAKEDVAKRMQVEARTEAEQMIYTVTRFLEKNAVLLSDVEIKTTLELCNALKSTLTQLDKDTILKGIDTLNEYTRPFAERLMNKAVSSALAGTHIDKI